LSFNGDISSGVIDKLVIIARWKVIMIGSFFTELFKDGCEAFLNHTVRRIRIMTVTLSQIADISFFSRVKEFNVHITQLSNLISYHLISTHLN